MNTTTNQVQEQKTQHEQFSHSTTQLAEKLEQVRKSNPETFRHLAGLIKAMSE